jgi:hypothetical protein
MSDESGVEVLRKGSKPIYKYEIRKPREWRVCVMIDDDYGDLLVSFDQEALQHWWGKDGRGTKTLREFLARTSDGYLADKLSYGKERWDGEKANRELNKGLVQALQEGRITAWEKADFESTMGNVMDHSSRDAFQMQLWHCENLVKVFGENYEDYPSGEVYANKKVQWFIDKVWPHLQRFIKKELEINLE